MTGRLLVLAAGLAAGLTAASGAQAQNLQPGMRTMIQQGGVEGSVLGGVVPFPYGADPYYGYVCDDPRYGRVVYRDPYAGRRYRDARGTIPVGYGPARVRVTVPRRQDW